MRHNPFVTQAPSSSAFQLASGGVGDPFASFRQTLMGLQSIDEQRQANENQAVALQNEQDLKQRKLDAEQRKSDAQMNARVKAGVKILGNTDLGADFVKNFVSGGGELSELLKLSRGQSTINNINPGDYTPESVAAFSKTGDYGTLKVKGKGASSPFSKINASDYTPESIGAFQGSGNYADLVPNLETKGKRRIISVKGVPHYEDTKEKVFPSLSDSVDYSVKDTENGFMLIPDAPGVAPIPIDYNGSPLQSGAAIRAKGVQGRSEQRQTFSKYKFDKKWAQDQTKLDISTINQLSDDYARDTKDLKDMAKGIKIAQGLMAKENISAADDKALQNTVSQLYNTAVRAQSELEQWRNFGDLPQRFIGGILRFTTGKYQDAQRQQIASLINNLESEVLTPSIQSIDDFYKKKAQAFEVDETLISQNIGVEREPNKILNMSLEELKSLDYSTLTDFEKSSLDTRMKELGL